MSNSHKGSKLLLANSVISIDNDTTFLAHYDITANDVLYGIEPISNVSTLREGKFGGGIAVEEGAVNTFIGSLFMYNNYGVPASLVDTGQTYNGDKVFRLGMTVDVAHSGNLSHFQTSLSSHGVYGGSQSWVLDTSYVSSIYWRPVNKLDVVVGGVASNTTGWSVGGNISLNDGWNRYYRFRTGAGVATKTDSVHHSFYCPSLQLDETIYIDFCCPQTEQGKLFPTSYVTGTRDAGILKYPADCINPYEGTISMWYKPHYPSSYVTAQTDSPKLLQAGNYYGNSSITLWNFNNSFTVYAKGSSDGAWSGSKSIGSMFTQNQWTMVSVTWKDKNWNIYVDGKLVGSFIATQGLGPMSGNNLYVGGDGGNGGGSAGRVANGTIDELRIDKVARTDEDIASWYISNQPFYPKGIYRLAY